MNRTISIALLAAAGLALGWPSTAVSQDREEGTTTYARASYEAASAPRRDRRRAVNPDRAGAAVFADNCGRCHNMRSTSERTDAQWSAIVAHIRVRANLTKGQSTAVEAFLYATNADDTPVRSASDSPATKPDVSMPLRSED